MGKSKSRLEVNSYVGEDRLKTKKVFKGLLNKKVSTTNSQVYLESLIKLLSISIKIE